MNTAWILMVSYIIFFYSQNTYPLNRNTSFNLGFQYTPPYPPLGDEGKKCKIENCEARKDECYNLINGILTDNGQCQNCTNIYEGACN